MIRSIRRIMVGLLVAAPMMAQPAAPRMRLVQDFRIDGEKEDIGRLLGGVFVLPSGKLAIADWFHFQLRFFDGTGKHVTDFGGEGRAAGQFSGMRSSLGDRAQFFGGTVADSVWVVDRTPERVTVVSSQGKLLRSETLPVSLGWQQPPSAASATELHGFELLAVYGDGSMLGRGTRGTHEEMVLISKSGSQRTLAILPHDSANITVALSRGGTSTAHVPFTERVLVAVAQDGNRFAIMTTHEARTPAGGTWTLTIISAKGDTLLAKKYPFTGLSIPSGMAENAVRGMAPTMDRPPAYGRPQQLDSLATAEVKRKVRAAVPLMSSPLKQIRIGLDNTILLIVDRSRWIDSSRRVMVDSSSALVLDEKGNAYADISLSKKGMPIRASHSNMWIQENGEHPSIIRYRIQPM